jgi:glutamyl-tRNA synthetase
VPPRVRFAPSPTGYLHIGGARTALFNWLFGRRHGGAFVLRIEDTDTERSSAAMIEQILDSLTWLGLSWDEGPGVGGPHAPYFQAQRQDRHRAAAERLLASGHAYEDAGAVRFRVPPGTTVFDDAVRGRIAFDNTDVEDFVILRSDRTPLYHLSVVVDDIDMEITDVIRGDDHISNTPKQILLYQALNAPVPAFAHVPLILGPDKKRLSKRHGATSVGEYRDQGYLPEAMVNFLALLGWSPGGDEEVFGRDELVGRFSLDGISGGNAVFNPEKLEWFNQQHILRMPAREIVSRIERELAAAGLDPATLEPPERSRLERVIDLVKPRARRLPDMASLARPFFGGAIDRDPAAVAKHLSAPDLAAHLSAWRDRIREVEPFEAAPLEAALRALAAERGVKPGPLIHATRVAVVGQAVSPGLFEVLELMGRDRALARLNEAEALLTRES